MAKTRVAINALCMRLTDPAGVEAFVRNVVMPMPLKGCDVELVLPSGDAPGIRACGGGSGPDVVETRLRGGPTPIRILREMFGLAVRLFRSDVVLSINNFGPLFGKPGQRRLVVIHDVWFLSESYNGPASHRWLFAVLLRLQLLGTHEVITVSAFSRKEIIARLSVNEDRVHVVPNCLPARETGEGTGVVTVTPPAGDWLLLIGSDRENKNIRNAVRGWQEFRASGDGTASLVLAGQYDQAFLNSLTQLAGAYAGDLVVAGFVDRETLEDLYARCSAVVFPSLYEGYGIPVIEAIGHEKPVLVSAGTVCEELAGEFGVVVDGTHVSSIASGLGDLLRFDVEASRGKMRAFREQVADCTVPARLLADLVTGKSGLS